ncbi:YibE/F family protein [Rhodococcus aerolatus]
MSEQTPAPTPAPAGHGHGLAGPAVHSPLAARLVVGLLVLAGLAVVLGAVLLWPPEQRFDVPLPLQNGAGQATTTEAGTVTAQQLTTCGGPGSQVGRLTGTQVPTGDASAGGYACTRTTVRIDSGPDAGRSTTLEITPGPGSPTLAVGDSLRLSRGQTADGAPLYDFYDFARGLPMAVLAGVFALAVVVVARWRGLRALLGLVIAFAILAGFVVPALLGGRSAVLVALVGGAAILFAVIYLAHGVSLRTSSALLGTLAALGLSGVLAQVAVALTRVTGLSEEQNTTVQVYLGQVSITGLLLAGFVIGSLGVLNDVTVTQASAAFELAALDPTAPRRRVYTGAMRVGRDHIASTVYTLVLAYAGSALPLLLLFSVAGRSLRDVLTGDVVAVEVVRALVGGTALVLAVPLTTAIAVALARPGRTTPELAVTRHRRA